MEGSAKAFSLRPSSIAVDTNYQAFVQPILGDIDKVSEDNFEIMQTDNKIQQLEKAISLAKQQLSDPVKMVPVSKKP